MLRPGIDAQGHRKSSRGRGRSDSSISAATPTTEATSVSDENAVPPQGEAEGASVKGNKASMDGATQDGTMNVGTMKDGTMKVGSMKVGTTKDVTVKDENCKEGNSVDDLTSSMSSLRMVPRSVTFGKPKGRSGFAKS